LIPEQWPDGRDHGPVLDRSKQHSESCDEPGAYVDRTTASLIRSTSPPRSAHPAPPPPAPPPLPPHSPITTATAMRTPLCPSYPLPIPPALASRPVLAHLAPNSSCALHRRCCSLLASSPFSKFHFVLLLVQMGVPMSTEDVTNSRCCFFLCHLVLELSLQDSKRSLRK